MARSRRLLRRCARWALAGAVLVGACRTPAPPAFTEADAAAVEAVLIAQRDAWNAGNIDAFMEGYVRGPELVFTSGAAVRRGYDEALARYRAKYVEHGKMGHLEFTELEVTGLGADSALVMGRWAVTESDQSGDGIFTLVLVRRSERWAILHDHASATPSAPPGS